ncbi:MAG: acyltransferase [Aestuariivirga sp.]
MKANYDSLQASRGVAALLVLLYHLGGAIGSPKYFNIPWFLIPFRFGQSGVEFFFVLSGFLITSVHLNDFNNPGRLANYFTKRAIRIFPVYWIIFVIAATLSSKLRATLPTGFFSLVKALLLIPQQSLDRAENSAPILDVAWTLQYEIIFYICLALFIFNQRIALSVICASLCWWAAAVFVGIPTAFPWHFLKLQYLILFVMGAGASTQFVSDKRFPLMRVALLLGAVMFAGLAIYEDLYFSSQLRPTWHTLLFGLASVLIICGIVAYERLGIITVPKWMVHLGDASYSLYLIHYPTLIVICKIAIIVGLAGYLGALLTYVIAFGITVTCAILFSFFVEMPLLRWLRAMKISRPRTQTH